MTFKSIKPNKKTTNTAESRMNPNVDFYFNKAKKWQDEMKELRQIVLGCQLSEELKWGVPSYAF